MASPENGPSLSSSAADESLSPPPAHACMHKFKLYETRSVISLSLSLSLSLCVFFPYAFIYLHLFFSRQIWFILAFGFVLLHYQIRCSNVMFKRKWNLFLDSTIKLIQVVCASVCTRNRTSVRGLASWRIFHILLDWSLWSSFQSV